MSNVKKLDELCVRYLKFNMSVFQVNEVNFEVACDELPKPSEDL